MKIVFVLLSLFFSLLSSAQVFHFEDTSTTLIKNTSQSPAHWYIEIYNDIGVDTSLRWKAHFENIPQEWNISMDAQTQNWPMIMDGDSSDFPLEITQDFPQKLIIGAMLNNTPGHGTAFFNIFDPDNRSVQQTISYEFIISALGLADLSNVPFVSLQNNQLLITNNQETTLEVVDLNGKRLFQNSSSTGFDLNAFAGKSSVFLLLTQGTEHYVFHVLVQRD